MKKTNIDGLFEALDFVVLEEQSNRSLLNLTQAPSWFQKLVPTTAVGECFQPEERFPFLENFLIDARISWKKESPIPLRSEPWIDIDTSGRELAIRAIAVYLAGRNFLLLELYSDQFEEKREILQKAREQALDSQRLKQAGEALSKSEAEARHLLCALPDSMFRLKTDGSYLSFGEVRGAGLEARAKKVHEVLPPVVAQELMRLVEKAIQNRTVEIFEYLSSFEGRERNLEARIAVSGSEEVIVILRDITDRKRAEAELEEILKQVKTSRDDLLLILNQLQLGTVLTDEDGRCIFLSEPAQGMFGIRRDNIMGRRWEDMPGFQPLHRSKLIKMAELPPKSRSRIPVHWETEDGHQYWMEVDLQDDPRNPKRKIYFLYDVSEVQGLRRMLDERGHFEALVGKTKPMQQVFNLIKELAEVDSIVLIEGETGTGKELVAKALHSCSHRRNKPFIAVNCAGLNESLVASQLFGHKRGSFTGAIEDARGVFEAADGGVIFLDEVGDIPLGVQTSLLRVLQEKEITRVGETRPRKVDVRILAATHRNLGDEVIEKNFRADLLYRIRVARIRIPPLRERKEDLPLLISRFLDEFRALMGRPIHSVSHEAMRSLMEYSWPGNVRELRSAIEYAVIHCRQKEIGLEDLPPELDESNSARVVNLPDSQFHHQDARQRLEVALGKANGNRALAARLLGIGRATLYRRMAAVGMSSHTKRS
jgi:PAS domain S-box-containing protein